MSVVELTKTGRAGKMSAILGGTPATNHDTIIRPIICLIALVLYLRMLVYSDRERLAKLQSIGISI